MKLFKVHRANAAPKFKQSTFPELFSCMHAVLHIGSINQTLFYHSFFLFDVAQDW
jgi:hypothetical protein